jgi:hypothetical protein
MLFVPSSIADESRRLSAIEGDEVDDFAEKNSEEIIYFLHFFENGVKK